MLKIELFLLLALPQIPGNQWYPMSVFGGASNSFNHAGPPYCIASLLSDAFLFFLIFHRDRRVFTFTHHETPNDEGSGSGSGSGSTSSNGSGSTSRHRRRGSISTSTSTSGSRKIFCLARSHVGSN